MMDDEEPSFGEDTDAQLSIGMEVRIPKEEEEEEETSSGSGSKGGWIVANFDGEAVEVENENGDRKNIAMQELEPVFPEEIGDIVMVLESTFYGMLGTVELMEGDTVYMMEWRVIKKGEWD
eukprot:TRINITY_DN862_c1_g3_i4.p2 TRINITY_DN862_c1_g3~~TRINITY_DN862_c1_g3_i4.p2  ORF type:complete len:121 (-),score=42.46 TRINITY_DN862_c1_g3_i4:546-908(-)